MEKHHPDQLNAIMARFSLEQAHFRFSALQNGFINDTYLALHDSVPLYILQRVNHSVFTNIDGLMGNVDKALKLLDAPGYVKITLVHTRTDQTYWNDDHGYWRVMSYIQGSTAYDTTTDATVAFEAGRIIGLFHTLLAKANTNDYVDTIPRFHDLALRRHQFEVALAQTGPQRIAAAGNAVPFAKKTLKFLADLDLSELPVRVCHNDTKLNNILFSKEDNTALCLIDLDTLMKGYFLYDFGDAFRTIVNTAPEDEKDHTRINFDPHLFEAFIDGIASNGRFLTTAETDSLFMGGVFMPFIHGLRALTDFLNGNVYYKVAYENQNLDRCLSLFDFTDKVLAQTTYIQEVIQKKLAVPSKT